jgi:hypothetical protein
MRYIIMDTTRYRLPEEVLEAAIAYNELNLDGIFLEELLDEVSGIYNNALLADLPGVYLDTDGLLNFAHWRLETQGIIAHKNVPLQVLPDDIFYGD